MIKQLQLVAAALSSCVIGLTADAQQLSLENSAFPTAPIQQISAPPPITQLIVKYKNDTVQSFNATEGRTKLATAAVRNGLALTYKRPMSGMAHVVSLPTPMSRAEAIAVSKRLEMDPNVEYAEIDEWVYPNSIPNDTYYSSQWDYFAPNTVTGNLGGINAPLAWDITRGQGVIVAVIDTGYTIHPDLFANLVMNGAAVAGYDFITDATNARDGDGRDADASDPGDWRAVNECGTGIAAANSSWHGTHVAGTIAAVTNNTLGLAGIAYEARILPLRTLGRCGGLSSDSADAIRWAAGLTVPGLPVNLNVARVINMSLGSASTCSVTTQSAITEARAAGTIVVAATGNSGLTTIGQPASCIGVIAVTAHTFQGDNASYANVGPGTTISAPGGGPCKTANSVAFTCLTTSPNLNYYVWSTALNGITTPTSFNSAGDSSGPDYFGKIGTSMATPHAAAVAALLFSKMPSLTPDEVTSLITSSARPHPTGTYCASITTGYCGSGLLDAKAALTKLSDRTPTLAVTPSAAVVQNGQTETLTATVTPRNGGSTAFTYSWTQTSGPTVQLSNTNTSSTTFVAANPGGTHSFLLTVRDGNGYTVTETAAVRSNNSPAINAPASATVIQGNTLTFTVSATDPENDTLTFVGTNLPTGATFNAATGQFNWPGVAASAGTYTFNVLATDGLANSTTATVSIAVTAPTPATPNQNNGGGGGGGSLKLEILLALLLTLYSQRKLAVKRTLS
ncbi:MAG: S8 family serine peptidase [Steroidobacteraceae bacterium]